tara:strand:+ start:1393 stop:1566 length:174 start_codon:yes stop_codon:yes gene_type:complete
MKKGELVKVNHIDGLFVYMGAGIFEGWIRVWSFMASRVILVRQSSTKMYDCDEGDNK